MPSLGYTTQARRLADVPRQVADLIETVTDQPVSPDCIDVEVALPGQAGEAWREAQRLRAEAETAARRASELSHDAARQLAAQGITMRDIGTVLGVSHQRAHQLVHGTATR